MSASARNCNRQEHDAGLAAYRRFRVAQTEGDLPVTYVEVDTATGEVASRPERCRDTAAAEQLAERMRGGSSKQQQL